MINFLKNNLLALILTIFLVPAIGVFASTSINKATSLSPNFEELIHFSMLSATTTQATSTQISIAGAKKAQVYFLYTNPTGTATTTFSVQVSPNGTDWYNYNKLISNVTNTNAQMPTRVASLQAVGTTTAMYALDLENDTFRDIRCITVFASTTITATDQATCELSVEF